MRKPDSNSLVDWTGAALEDLAHSVGRLARDLGNADTDPNWIRKSWRDSWDIISLRRWSFLLPGGGALRSGRPPRPIAPNTHPSSAARPNGTGPTN